MSITSQINKILKEGIIVSYICLLIHFVIPNFIGPPHPIFLDRLANGSFIIIHCCRALCFQWASSEFLYQGEDLQRSEILAHVHTDKVVCW